MISRYLIGGYTAIYIIPGGLDVALQNLEMAAAFFEKKFDGLQVDVSPIIEKLTVKEEYEGDIGFIPFTPWTVLNDATLQLETSLGTVCLTCLDLERYFEEKSYEGFFAVHIAIHPLRSNFKRGSNEMDVFWELCTDLFPELDAQTLLAGENGKSTLSNCCDKHFPYRIDDFLWDYCIFPIEKVTLDSISDAKLDIYTKQINEKYVVVSPNKTLSGMVEDDYIDACKRVGLQCPWSY